ncbi:MAG: vitamin K epoxide reductase family protein [Patescibacteria group bacterium]|nr:vitamin K epoxide reductase family protein [Patescibacteria group bacterium]
MQKNLITPSILLALALIGLGDTLYLAYFQYLNLIPTCAISGCEQVLTSVYSKFFGVPWSYIGLVYYVYALALGVLLTIEPRSRALRLAALAYFGTGVLYSCWAIFYIQLGLIHALCQYCALSALTTLALFITSLWHWRASTRSA